MAEGKWPIANGQWPMADGKRKADQASYLVGQAGSDALRARGGSRSGGGVWTGPPSQAREDWPRHSGVGVISCHAMKLSCCLSFPAVRGTAAALDDKRFDLDWRQP